MHVELDVCDFTHMEMDDVHQQEPIRVIYTYLYYEKAAILFGFWFLIYIWVIVT
jgi:hypothetical protein